MNSPQIAISNLSAVRWYDDAEERVMRNNNNNNSNSNNNQDVASAGASSQETFQSYLHSAASSGFDGDFDSPVKTLEARRGKDLQVEEEEQAQTAVSAAVQNPFAAGAARVRRLSPRRAKSDVTEQKAALLSDGSSSFGEEENALLQSFRSEKNLHKQVLSHEQDGLGVKSPLLPKKAAPVWDEKNDAGGGGVFPQVRSTFSAEKTKTPLVNQEQPLLSYSATSARDKEEALQQVRAPVPDRGLGYGSMSSSARRRLAEYAHRRARSASEQQDVTTSLGVPLEDVEVSHTNAVSSLRFPLGTADSSEDPNPILHTSSGDSAGSSSAAAAAHQRRQRRGHQRSISWGEDNDAPLLQTVSFDEVSPRHNAAATNLVGRHRPNRPLHRRSRSEQIIYEALPLKEEGDGTAPSSHPRRGMEHSLSTGQIPSQSATLPNSVASLTSTNRERTHGGRYNLAANVTSSLLSSSGKEGPTMGYGAIPSSHVNNNAPSSTRSSRSTHRRARSIGDQILRSSSYGDELPPNETPPLTSVLKAASSSPGRHRRIRSGGLPPFSPIKGVIPPDLSVASTGGGSGGGHRRVRSGSFLHANNPEPGSRFSMPRSPANHRRADPMTSSHRRTDSMSSHRRSDSMSSAVSMASIASAAAASITSVRSDITKSALFKGTTESGLVQFHLPMDDVQLVMDSGLQSGILCKTLNDEEEFTQYQLRSIYHDLDLEYGYLGGVEDHGGEICPCNCTCDSCMECCNKRGLPPARYMLTVDDDLYKRVIGEIADSKSMPCGLYFCGHHEDVHHPSIGIAVAIVLVVFGGMVVVMMCYSE